MKSHAAFRWAAFLFAAVFMGAIGKVGFAQERSSPHSIHPQSEEEQEGTSRRMMDSCRQMMEERENMTADVQSMSTKLDELVSKMNSAAGDAKIEAMTAVINEMASQRQELMKRMTEMQPHMMGHMMRHMQMDTMKKMSGGGDCPMMKDTMNKKEEPSPQHSH